MVGRSDFRRGGRITAPAIGAHAGAAVRRTIRAGAENYERRRDVPKLTRLDLANVATETVEEAQAIIALLWRALRAERNRARSGHWTYDLNRHIALRHAYVAETQRLALIKAKGAAVLQRPPTPGRL